MPTAFQDLPAEVRNEIYQLAVYDLVGTQLRPTNPRHQRQPHLALTCRQIRNDVLPIFYGSRLVSFFASRTPADIRLSLEEEGIRLAEKWLRAIGPTNQAMIKDLWLTIHRHKEYFYNVHMEQTENGYAIDVKKYAEPFIKGCSAVQQVDSFTHQGSLHQAFVEAVRRVRLDERVGVKQAILEYVQSEQRLRGVRTTLWSFLIHRRHMLITALIAISLALLWRLV